MQIWFSTFFNSTFSHHTYITQGQGNTKTRKTLICLQKLINSSLMKLKLWTRLRLRQHNFFTFYFARIYFNFFRMIRLFTMFLVYLLKSQSQGVYFFNTNKTRKVVAHSSGFQKLKNSNLKILKFEALYADAVKF